MIPGVLVHKVMQDFDYQLYSHTVCSGFGTTHTRIPVSRTVSLVYGLQLRARAWVIPAPFATVLPTAVLPTSNLMPV